jgi:hypothetical protein
LEKKIKISKKYARMMEFHEEIRWGGRNQRRGWCMDPTHASIIYPFHLPKIPCRSPPTKTPEDPCSHPPELGANNMEETKSILFLGFIHG